MEKIQIRKIKKEEGREKKQFLRIVFLYLLYHAYKAFKRFYPTLMAIQKQTKKLLTEKASSSWRT